MQLSFLSQAERGRNDFVPYLLTFLLLIIGNTIGSFPLLGIIIAASIGEGVGAMEALQNMEQILKNPSAGGVDTNLIFFGMLLTFVFTLLGLWVGVRFLHKRPFATLINGFEQIRWSRFFYGCRCLVWYYCTDGGL